MTDENPHADEKRELCELIRSKGSWEVQVSSVEAKRIQKDWDRHMRYKVTLSQGQTFLGNAQSLWWIVNLMWTDFRYPAAAKVAEVYYECWRYISPVEFAPSEGGNRVTVIFRPKAK